ncbi:MAG: GDP-mannose 4,6-dehydratase [Fimbriimonadaceae bacterium]|nr:GDP-mannose 4,6-dehydratase [Fimbriimonadaceae bacterium]
MPRVLVTGAAGFAGRHLTTLLRQQGDDVVPLVRQPAGLPGEVTADLIDPAATATAVQRAAPAVVYHLAAASSPSASLRDPGGTLQANVVGTANLLQAALAIQPRPRVLLVTSSEVYGSPPPGPPLTATTACQPRTPYAVSKLAVHYLGQQFHLAHGLPVIEARPFNHLGPGQALGFVAPDFASQIAAIAAGRREPLLRVGDLRAAKDFSDVRDIVRGYALLAAAGQAGATYHLCRGQATSIQELLDTLLDLARVPVEVIQDHRRVGAGPPPVVCGDASPAAALGWRASRPLRQTLADVLAEWRDRVAAGWGG